MFIRHDIEMSCVHSSVHSLTVNSPIVAHRTVRQSTASIWQPFLGELDVLIPLGPLSVNSPDILQLTQLPSFVIFWYYNIHWYTAMIYFVQELQPASPSACVWASWHAYGIQSQAQELQQIITNPANVAWCCLNFKCIWICPNSNSHRLFQYRDTYTSLLPWRVAPTLPLGCPPSKPQMFPRDFWVFT
jgi:hypothetical protein